MVLQGNGALTVFNVNFVPDSASNIQVTYTDSNGTNTTLSPSQYTITIPPLVGDELWATGFTVTYPLVGSPIAAGTTLTVQRVLSFQQLVTISDQGDFGPQVTEQALDVLELQIQQVAARTGSYRGVWATGQIYNFGDIVQDGVNGSFTNNLYVCALANTSGVWTTDLSNGDWSLALNIQTLIVTGTYLPLTGGTISGNLTVLGTTTLASTSATSLTSTTLNVTGNSTIGGALNVTGNSTINGSASLGAGSTASTQAATNSSTLIATTAMVQSAISSHIPYGSISGLLPTTISGTNTTASVTISSGQAADGTNTILYSSAGFSFSVSSGNVVNGYQGGTTLPNSSTIHFFVIATATDTSWSGCFSSINLTPTLPAGYIGGKFRRIFSLLTNSSGALISGKSDEVEGGSMVFYTSSTTPDINGTFSNGANLVTVSVPTGIKVQYLYRCVYNPSGSDIVAIDSPDGNNFLSASCYDGTGNVSSFFTFTQTATIITNTSAQIVTLANGTTTGNVVTPRGWKDSRRS